MLWRRTGELERGNGADMMNIIFIHVRHFQIINITIKKNNCKKNKIGGMASNCKNYKIELFKSVAW